MVKNLPAIQETQVQSLAQEDPWKREWLLNPVFLPGKSYGQGSLKSYSTQGCKKSDITERLILPRFFFFMCICTQVFKNIYLFGCVESQLQYLESFLRFTVYRLQNVWAWGHVRSQFPNQELNQCPLHCMVDSQLLGHQGSPLQFLKLVPQSIGQLCNLPQTLLHSNIWQSLTWNSKLVPNRKRSTSRLYTVTLLV